MSENPRRVTDSGVAARISHLPRIVGFRNRIIHGYDAIDDATVWGVIGSHLPALVAEVERLLKDTGDEVGNGG